MQKRWLIKITGKRRTEVDVDLVIQAVIALWQQLRDEQRGASKGEAGKEQIGDKSSVPDATEGTI